MTSHLLPSLGRIVKVAQLRPQITHPLQLVRHAGHSKWQNIKSTKEATDQAKSKMISRYVMMVRRAVISGGYQGDPKLNGKLATLLAEAQKLSLPKATMERAIERALNIKIISMNLVIQGPNGSVIIVRCETDNTANMRREVKKAIKNRTATLLADESLLNMFESKGVIRASTFMSTTDRREIDEDYAQEAAIMSNAEDVRLEVFGDDEEARAWVFATDATAFESCKSSLEKLGFKIISSELELVPYRAVDFGSDAYEEIEDIVKDLRTLEQVVDVFHNAAEPGSG